MRNQLSAISKPTNKPDSELTIHPFPKSSVSQQFKFTSTYFQYPFADEVS